MMAAGGARLFWPWQSRAEQDAGYWATYAPPEHLARETRQRIRRQTRDGGGGEGESNHARRHVDAWKVTLGPI